MLEINSETVCWIIAKARQFHAKEDDMEIREQPGYPSDDAVLQILSDDNRDPTYDELCLTIRDLEPDQQMSLVALMWLGRGDFELEEWEQALYEARENWTPRTAEYLITTPLLADYLMEGLVQHGYTCNGS